MEEPKIVTGALLVELCLTNFGITKSISAGGAIAKEFGNAEYFTQGGDQTTKSRKWIIPKYLYENIARFQRETRAMHSVYTGGMKWTTNMDIISTKAYSGAEGRESYTQWHEDRKAELETLAYDFAYSLYPQAKYAARTELGQLYDSSEYPHNDVVKNSIGMSVNIRPIPIGSDFRCSLEKKEKAHLEEEYNDMLWKVQRKSVLKLSSALSEKLLSIATSLKEGKRVHKGTYKDLYEFADRLPMLDFTDDPKLKELAGDVVGKVMGDGWLDANMVKNSEEVKDNVINSAVNISRNLDAYAETL